MLAARACLSTAEVAAYVDPGAASHDRGALVHHVDSCETCRRMVAAAMRAARSATLPRGEPELHPGDRIDRYAVFEAVGVGGMGAVYRAFDPRLDRKIALKLLRPGLGDEHHRERMQREAKMLARLAHPNVVTVHDAGTWQDRVYIAMEFVEGATLGDWLAERTRAWPDVLDVLLQAAAGLASAHAAGLVHRDFKPHNLLIGRDGRARVSDFGLAELGTPEQTAQAGDSAFDEVPLTATGVVLGTPAYMAPEQARGKAVDAKSDQFSFCVTAYEALFGERPFAAASFAALKARFASGKPPSVPRATRVPRRIVRCLLRGLAIEPERRFASMIELAAALRSARTRSRRFVAAGAALATLALAAGWWWGRPHEASAAEQCDSGAAAAASAMWNPQRMAAVDHAFAAQRVPYAADAERGALAGIQDYVDRWRGAHRAACRATRVDGSQSEHVLDVRIACLDDKRRHVNALVDELAHVDATTLRQVAGAIGALPPLDSCGRLQELEAVAPPPTTGTPRGTTNDELADELEAINVARDFGKFDEGLRRATAVMPKVDAFDFKPLQARFHYMRGELLDHVGKGDEARAELEKSVFLAEASHDQEVKIHALVRLLIIAGTRLDKPAAERWSHLAEAALDARPDASPGERANLLMAQGIYAYQADDMKQAASKFEQALALSRRDPESKLTLGLLNDLASVYFMQERDAEAKQLWHESLDQSIAAYGPMHPDVGMLYGNVAMFEQETGDRQASLEHFRRALEIQEATLDKGHPMIGRTHVHLAVLLHLTGAQVDAAQHFATGLKMLEAAYPDGHPDLSDAQRDYAGFLQDTHDDTAALALYRRVLAYEQTVRPKGDPTIAKIEKHIAELTSGRTPR